MIKPKLALIPSGYSDGKVFSVLPANGDGDFTFSRGSNATRVNKDGLIEAMPLEVSDTELVTNGGFDTDSDWTKGTGWSISAGSARFNSASTYAFFSQDLGAIVGNTYLIKLSCTVTSGDLNITLANDPNFRITTTGVYEFRLTPVGGGGSDTLVRIYTTIASSNISIDNISIKEITSGFDTPRLDYTDSSCPSLLLEPQRTNLVTYSEDFSNGYWIKTEATVTLNTTTSPDGSLNASKLTPSTISSNHKIASGNVSIVSSLTSYWFVKSNGYSKVSLREDAAVGKYASFDLSQGIVLDSSTSSKIEDYGNGWFRIELNDDLTNVTARNSLYVLPDSYISGSPNLVNWSADGTSSIFIWGAQSEEGSYATSYIPTNGAAATRLADECTDAGTSDTFNDSEGVLMAEISALANDGTTRLISLSNGSDNNRLNFYYRSTANQILVKSEINNGTPTDIVVDVSDATSF